MYSIGDCVCVSESDLIKLTKMVGFYKLKCSKKKKKNTRGESSEVFVLCCLSFHVVEGSSVLSVYQMYTFIENSNPVSFPFQR